MMSKKQLLFNVSLVIILGAFVTIIIGRRLIFPCEGNWLFFGIWLFSFISFPLLFYYLLKKNNVDESRWFWTVITLLVLSAYTFHKENGVVQKEIKKNGGVVTFAIVYKKYSSIQSAESIYCVYSANDEDISLQYNCSKEIYNKLAVGDTILIVYSLRCSKWNLPFDYFPSSKEIQQCKNGCLLKNGELLIVN